LLLPINANKVLLEKVESLNFVETVPKKNFNFLSSQNRVTNRLERDRNFHIFYQLLSGADIQFLSKFSQQYFQKKFRESLAKSFDLSF
jgi:hypothetical protein